MTTHVDYLVFDNRPGWNNVARKGVRDLLTLKCIETRGIQMQKTFANFCPMFYPMAIAVELQRLGVNRSCVRDKSERGPRKDHAGCEASGAHTFAELRAVCR